MKKSALILNYDRFHFIGIGGISMSALAKYLLFLGKTVTGSEITETDETKKLTYLGAVVHYSHRAENLQGAEAVVYTSAISQNNPELIYAKQKGLPLIKRSQLLRAVSVAYRRTVGVAGSHGKTTATAMLTHALTDGGLDPTAFIGGYDLKYGNLKRGTGDTCIYEACEYKRNFLDLKPYVSVVLNVDKDHMESFGDETTLINSFREFSSGTIAVINADDINSSSLITPTTVTFGIENQANYYATDITKCKSGYSFTANGARRLGKIKLKVSGKHNIYNALAVIATSEILGVPFYKTQKALNGFNGVTRRMECLGKIFGAKVIADYAHHPKEIMETYKAFEEGVTVVFQPHTYSRTELLMDDFISVLKKIPDLVIYKTYPAREEYNERGSAKTLYDKLKVEHIGICTYAHTVTELTATLKKRLNANQTVVFFGAGDIYEIARSLTKKPTDN